MKYAALIAIGLLSVEGRLKQYPGVTFLPENAELVMGIDKDDLMQNNPSHWRKAWPEGDTDNGEGEETVLGRLDTKKRSHKDARK